MSTLRSVFYNIYGYKWYPDKENKPHLHSGPISLRQQMKVELISAYQPDVLGMQEYCKIYHKGMTPLLLEVGYAEVDVAHAVSHSDGTKINYTPLFYHPETMPDPDKNDGSVFKHQWRFLQVGK